MDWTIALLLGLTIGLPLIPILWDVLDLRNFFHAEPVARWTAVVGIATVFLVAATIYNAWILNVTDDTLRDTLEASNRAWLSVNDGVLSQEIEHPDGPVATVHYRNIGRDPALDVRIGAGLIPRPILGSSGSLREYPEVPWPQVGTVVMSACKSVVPSQGEGQAVFPSNTHEKNASTGMTAPWDRERLLKGQDMLVLVTCLSYRTWKKVRRTSDCMYLVPAPGKSSRQWQFRSCPVGNFAE